MGLDQAARDLWKQARAASEEPTVTLIFPDAVLPSPQLQPKQPKQYVRTTQNNPAKAKPLRADFVSDRNTVAASKEAPFPDGSAPLPSTKGTDHPTLELANRRYRDGNLGEDTPPPAPSPSVTPRLPQESPSMPQQTAVAEPTALAKLLRDVDDDDASADRSKLRIEIRKPDGSDAPAPQPQVAAPVDARMPAPPPPRRALDEFSPFTQTSRVKGTIGNKGDDAVNAEDSPWGRFRKAVNAAVEKKWHYFRSKNAGSVSYGYLKVRFFVRPDGKPEDIEFVEKADNPLMEDFTLEAILKADIPAIPKELLPMLENGRYPVEYDILIQ